MIRSLPAPQRRFARVLLVIGALGLPARAHADGPSRETLAQTLFDEARALYERGSFSIACEKWRASDELDPKGGTMLNLAMCREKEGRVASAWTAYAEARNRSAREGRRDRVTFAEARIKSLEPMLPKLRVSVAAGRDAQVSMDDAPLPPAAWSTPVPVDPGRHVVRANAAGRLPFTSEVTVELGQTVEVVVPSLPSLEASSQPTRNADPSSDGAPPKHEGPRSRTVLAWSLAAVGAGSLGVGTYFGISALDARREAERLCREGQCDSGARTNDDARSKAWVSNVGVGLGVVALATGIVLLLTD